MKGNLLIAEPFIGDPNFERTVVLLCEHNEEGSFGFVLNQICEFTLNQVLEEPLYTDMPLSFGGPVAQNTLHFIHRLGNQIDDAQQITAGVYWGGDFEQIRTLLQIGKLTENDVRFFVGYSGWSSGQLLQEIKEKVWITTPADTTLLFDTESPELWRTILKRMGGRYKMLSNYPIDPRLN
jgi:putative transcriptional regulator